jgi:hypothetical protein
MQPNVGVGDWVPGVVVSTSEPSMTGPHRAAAHHELPHLEGAPRERKKYKAALRIFQS